MQFTRFSNEEARTVLIIILIAIKIQYTGRKKLKIDIRYVIEPFEPRSVNRQRQR